MGTGGLLRRYIPATTSLDTQVTTAQNLEAVKAKLDRCTKEQVVLWCGEQHGAQRRVPATCGIRICEREPCAKRRRLRAEDRIGWVLAAMNQPKMLTLTVRGHRGLTKSTVAEISGYFYRFLRDLRASQPGVWGVRVLEIVKKVDGWYFHFHCAVQMQYVPQARLSAMWKDATGGSYIVDIRKGGRRPGLRRYLVKYIAKALATPKEEDRVTVREYVAGFYRVRMFNVFGDRYGKLAPMELRGAERCECGSLFHFFDIMVVRTEPQISEPPPPPTLKNWG